jgi:hypothetical protein
MWFVLGVGVDPMMFALLSRKIVMSKLKVSVIQVGGGGSMCGIKIKMIQEVWKLI